MAALRLERPARQTRLEPGGRRAGDSYRPAIYLRSAAWFWHRTKKSTCLRSILLEYVRNSLGSLDLTWNRSPNDTFANTTAVSGTMERITM